MSKRISFDRLEVGDPFQLRGERWVKIVQQPLESCMISPDAPPNRNAIGEQAYDNGDKLRDSNSCLVDGPTLVVKI